MRSCCVFYWEGFHLERLQGVRGEGTEGGGEGVGKGEREGKEGEMVTKGGKNGGGWEGRKRKREGKGGGEEGRK